MHDYRRLRVWQRAHQLALDVYRSTQAFPAAERYGLRDQMRRAAVSVSANIAEGAGRGDGFFRNYLRISAGSAAELESELRIARDLGYLTRADTESLLNETDAVRRMLWKLINAQTST